MQVIYTYIPETNYVSKEYSVAAILFLLFMVLISLVLLLLLLLLLLLSPTFRSSTFCTQNEFLCFIWIPEQTVIISLYSVN